MSKRFETTEDFDSGNNIFEGISSTHFIFIDPMQETTKYRLDDSINVVRKPNLSAMDQSQEICYEELDFRQSLEERYGSKLLILLEDNFENLIIDGRYIWNPSNWKIDYLKSHFSNDSFELSENENIINLSFGHSYRYSANMSNTDNTVSFDTAQAFLKSVIKHKIKMIDFLNFYQGNYNGTGIVNAYLRLLDVYNELYMAKLEHSNPGMKYFRIKIFETSFLEEYENEQKTGIVSNAIDEELLDLLDHNQLIIPINVSRAF